MDVTLSSFHIVVMNLMKTTRPQIQPGIEPLPSKRQEIVSTDEVLYLQPGNEIMTEEKADDVSDNLEETVVNHLPPESNQIQQEQQALKFLQYTKVHCS